LGGAALHPAAFDFVLIYTLAWLIFDREHFEFNAIATLIVWLMILSLVPAGETRSQFMPSSTNYCTLMNALAPN
jgi:hypothetical protein